MSRSLLYVILLISLIVGLVNDVPWQLTCVYDLTTPTLKLFFWEDLKCIRNSFEGAWMLTGDFNSCLNQKD